MLFFSIFEGTTPDKRSEEPTHSMAKAANPGPLNRDGVSRAAPGALDSRVGKLHVRAQSRWFVYRRPRLLGICPVGGVGSNVRKVWVESDLTSGPGSHVVQRWAARWRRKSLMEPAIELPPSHYRGVATKP
jgi:hypothetical protein